MLKNKIMNIAEFILKNVLTFLCEFAIDYDKRDEYNLKIAPKNSAVILYILYVNHFLEVQDISYPSEFKIEIEKLPSYVRLTIRNRTVEAILQNPNFENVFHNAEMKKVYRIHNVSDLLDTLPKIESSFKINLNKTTKFEIDDFTNNPVLVKRF